MIRFKQGRTVYNANDVQRVCDYYISIAGSGTPITIHVLQFLRNACLAFASTGALAQLKTLPAPALRPTLDEHFNILLADSAPARLQAELDTYPQSLLFIGNVVDFAHLQSLASADKGKAAARIIRSFSQSALAILIRYEEGITCFLKQDIQTLWSYMRELNIRGADTWVSLVAFLRDAARPFASSSLRRALNKSTTSNDDTDVVKQYNNLVIDGALDKLVDAAHTRSNPNFHVKAGGSRKSLEVADQYDGQLFDARDERLPEQLGSALSKETTDKLFSAGYDEADDEADDETCNKENVDPNAKRPHSSIKPSAVQKDDSDDLARFCLTGHIGPAGNALPSVTNRKHHERTTLLSPRAVRDLVRQYDMNNPQTRQDLVAQKEVFYVGGKKRYQIRPEYFWVLAQQVEDDEPPITPAQMATICPNWQRLLPAPRQQVQPLARRVTLEEVAGKLEALQDEVAALARMNKELKQQIRKLTDSSCSKQRNEVSSFSLSSGKKRRFGSDSEGDTDIVDTPTKVRQFGTSETERLIVFARYLT